MTEEEETRVQMLVRAVKETLREKQEMEEAVDEMGSELAKLRREPAARPRAQPPGTPRGGGGWTLTEAADQLKKIAGGQAGPPELAMRRWWRAAGFKRQGD